MRRQKGTAKKGPPRWQPAFLECLALTGIVLRACLAVKIARHVVYDHRKMSPEFAAAWDLALADSADMLIEEARRRAYAGVQEPVVYKGELSGVWVSAEGKAVAKDTKGASLIPLTVTKYSDSLLMFLIKGVKPEYRENRIAHEITGRLEIAKAQDMTDDELAAIAGRGSTSSAERSSKGTAAPP